MGYLVDFSSEQRPAKKSPFCKKHKSSTYSVAAKYICIFYNQFLFQRNTLYIRQGTPPPIQSLSSTQGGSVFASTDPAQLQNHCDCLVYCNCVVYAAQKTYQEMLKFGHLDTTLVTLPMMDAEGWECTKCVRVETGPHPTPNTISPTHSSPPRTPIPFFSITCFFKWLRERNVSARETDHFTLFFS